MASSIIPDSDDIKQYLELMDSDCESDWESASQTSIDDPDLLNFNKELEAYEGFYITDKQNLRQYFGMVVPSRPGDLGGVTVAAKFAIEHYNQTAEETLEFEEHIRSNWTLGGGGTMFYITFGASNGKFYETQVSVVCGGLGEFYFLRPAKHYPNLGPLSSSPPSESE